MTQGWPTWGWGGQGPQISVCVGSRDRKGVGSKLSHSSLHLASGGAPAVYTPSTGGERGKAAPLGPAADSRVSGSPWVLVETASGEAPSQGDPEKGALFLPGPLSRQRALVLVSSPERDGEGLGAGPCHRGLFSGQELGIKRLWREELGRAGSESPH